MCVHRTLQSSFELSLSFRALELVRSTGFSLAMKRAVQPLIAIKDPHSSICARYAQCAPLEYSWFWLGNAIDLLIRLLFKQPLTAEIFRKRNAASCCKLLAGWTPQSDFNELSTWPLQDVCCQRVCFSPRAHWPNHLKGARYKSAFSFF